MILSPPFLRSERGVQSWLEVRSAPLAVSWKDALVSAEEQLATKLRTQAMPRSRSPHSPSSPASVRTKPRSCLSSARVSSAVQATSPASEHTSGLATETGTSSSRHTTNITLLYLEIFSLDSWSIVVVLQMLKLRDI